MDFQPFQISDPRREASDILRARMGDEGYLFVPGLIDTTAIKHARHDILAACTRAGWLAPGSEPDDGIVAPGVRYVVPEPPFMRIYHEVQQLESFHALAHQQAILDLVGAIVQDRVLVHPRNIARIIFPQNTAHTTPAHQDYIHIKGTAETYTCWFPLGDCPLDLGGLAIMKGSHRAGIFEYQPMAGAGGKGVVTDGLPYHWVAGPLHAGDALLFHSHVIHKGLDNLTTDRLRVSVDFRYQGATQPVAMSSLEPHMHGLTWEQVYAGWQSPRYQYYWQSMPLTVVGNS